MSLKIQKRVKAGGLKQFSEQFQPEQINKEVGEEREVENKKVLQVNHRRYKHILCLSSPFPILFSFFMLY